MQAAKQQQIVVYFIEEAKEHLDTIEQGLLNLKATIRDPEQMNELFRAAHSVKGGAAMLGFSGIQKVGHHLEDGFKLLKEHPIAITQRLEDLFLKGFDVLKELVEDLQSPYSAQEQNSERAVQAAEPMFQELQGYLANLVNPGGAAPVMGRQTASQTASRPAAIHPKLPTVLNSALKKMLELFKQGDTPSGRQQLVVLCTKLAPLHPSSDWRNLLKLAQTAIGESKAPYSTLAPVVIREIKQASDLLIAGRAAEIAPSQPLKQLVAPTQPALSLAGSANHVAIAGKSQQLTIPTEPRAAARVLLGAFSKAELIELAEFIMKAIQ